MQQAQQNKVVVETEAKKDVAYKGASNQAPVQLGAELLKLVGGGNSSSMPTKGW